MVYDQIGVAAALVSELEVDFAILNLDALDFRAQMQREFADDFVANEPTRRWPEVFLDNSEAEILGHGME